jgi:hypothetical protein
MRRGQLSLSVLEAGIAALLVLSVASLFVLSPTAADRSEHLDRHASDLGDLLVTGGPETPRISAVAGSADVFDRDAEALESVARTVLPAAVQYRVETPHGPLGDRRPPYASAVSNHVVTANGTVSIWVWYA